MENQTDSSLSKLQEFLQSHKEKSSLQLKIKFNKHQNLQKIQVIEEELSKLTHLTDLTLHVSHHTILKARGYHILSNAIINLIKLNNLSFKVDKCCFLENEGLSILEDMISHLPEIVTLKFEIGLNNYISAEAAQKFFDSISANTKLRNLDLNFKEIRRSEEENIHFWRGLSNLNNYLETLNLSFNSLNYGYSDQIELLEQLPHLIKLRNLSLFIHKDFEGDTRILDELFLQVGKMIELRSLQIDFSMNDIQLNDSRRKEIIRNLSNLKSLQRLELNSLGQYLFKMSFDEYINLIIGLQQLQKLLLLQQCNHAQIASLGQTLLELKNLVHFDLVLCYEHNDTWKGFFSDLSQSFRQMHNLLNFNIRSYHTISEKGCNIIGECFQYLQPLETFKLYLRVGDHYYKTQLLQNICKMRNLKELEIDCQDDVLEQFFESITQLNLLEKLCLKRNGSLKSDQHLKNTVALCKTLMNLRRLKSLECFFFFRNLDDQCDKDMLENAFENLSELEYLKLNFTLEKKSNEQQNISLIKNLTNLKTMKIRFHLQAFNIFRSSDTTKRCKYQLKECSLRLSYYTGAQQLIEFLDSLSSFSLKKLSLKMSLGECDEKQEQLRVTFSKFSSLRKLTIRDKTKVQECLTYLHGIKQMKSLSTLKLDYYNLKITYEEVKILFDTLNCLINLQTICITLNRVQYFGEMKEITELNYQKLLRNLKRLEFQCSLQTNDGSFNRQISAAWAIPLNLYERKQSYLQDYEIDPLQTQSLTHETIITEDQCLKEEPEQLSIQNQKQNEVDSEEFSITSLEFVGSESDGQQGKCMLNEFDLNKSQYLNQLYYTFRTESEIPIEIELLTPLKDLQSECRLVILNLNLGRLKLNQEQISYLSRNLKSFSNLQSFEITFECFQDDYHLLFDSFSYLYGLKVLKISTNISENEAISLGNSLKAMRNLQICQIEFNRESTYGFLGIYSILNGLKHARQLINLNLDMFTNQVFSEEEKYILFSECFSNSKFLQYLNFQIGIDSLNPNCWRDSMSSIGSLVFLSSLKLDIKEANPFNQETLDELLKAFTQLKSLNNYKILIYLENNVNIEISEEFANIFNSIHPYSLLIVTTHENQVIFEQFECYFAFQSKTMENLQVNCLKYLNETKEVLFEIEETKILKKIGICSARKMTLKLNKFNVVEEEEREYEEERESFDNLCGFLFKCQNIFELSMKVFLSSKLKLKESTLQLAQSLTQLKSLKVLNLEIQNYDNSIGSHELNQMLKILKSMGQLQNLYLKTDNTTVNEKITPRILRAILRLVIFNQNTQIYDNFY